ncbi:hypothetical protein [Halomonas smyrnensis]|uniref:hypothetical protein n=1 Tax=Halomonas smyrnensis TaxID=720605 RepID=UPI00030B8832|nr:hypothetical protein [Halomonas smyrnensis]
MWKKLFGKPPIRVWVIKQVDDGLLHLCGEGHIEPGSKRARESVLTGLQDGTYQGAVALADNGLVLNARLFAALVPHDGLHLDADGLAHWQGRVWRTSQVPQRCWTYEGALIARATTQGPLDLVSSEDVSGIRRRASGEGQTASTRLQFGAADELEGEAEFAERWRRHQEGASAEAPASSPEASDSERQTERRHGDQ